MLHGEIKVNHMEIGRWTAQNVGKTMYDGVYMCSVKYTNLQGKTESRTFFIKHNYGDGALALTALVVLEYANRQGEPVYTPVTEWFDFCEKLDLDPYDAMGDHCTLKREL